MNEKEDKIKKLHGNFSLSKSAAASRGVDSDLKIKKGLNIYLYYWAILAFFILLMVNYFSRNFKVEALNIGLMISIVSFLFGFLITITFSMLLSRVFSLKEALATETGRLASLFNLSKQLGKEFHEKIRGRIDDYTISTLSYYTNYEYSREAFYGIYSDIEFMEVKSERQSQSAGSFLYILGELSTAREKLEYLTSKRIEWSLKFSNYLLGGILMLLLFLNRGDSFTNAIFVVLSTIIFFIFLIIEDYDSLRIGDYVVNISNSEQIFDLIEKERFYPEDVLGRVKLERGKAYRIGIFRKGKEEIKRIVYKR